MPALPSSSATRPSLYEKSIHHAMAPKTMYICPRKGCSWIHHTYWFPQSWSWELRYWRQEGLPGARAFAEEKSFQIQALCLPCRVPDCLSVRSTESPKFSAGYFNEVPFDLRQGTHQTPWPIGSPLRVRPPNPCRGEAVGFQVLYDE